MSIKYQFNSQATAIGSMPHKDASEACALIFKYFKDLPYWPQLPTRSYLENMVAQYSEGLPGLELNEGNVVVKRSDSFDSQLEQLYLDYDENNYDNYSISNEYAAGLHAFIKFYKGNGEMVKGQIIGPISFGLMANGEDGKGILYDDLIAETVAKFLRLKAAWQEAFLRTISKNTVIFIDEPSLTMLGSAFVAISTERVMNLIDEVLGGIKGFKGVHCCGGTDWSILLRSSVDIISFDAYNYADSFSCYSNDVEAFLKRGGTIAWGIVPNTSDNLKKETVASLLERLEAAMASYAKNSISIKQIASQSILTPSCTLATLSDEAAVVSMQLIAELSKKVQQKYSL